MNLQVGGHRTGRNVQIFSWRRTLRGANRAGHEPQKRGRLPLKNEAGRERSKKDEKFIDHLRCFLNVSRTSAVPAVTDVR